MIYTFRNIHHSLDMNDNSDSDCVNDCVKGHKTYLNN